MDVLSTRSSAIAPRRLRSAGFIFVPTGPEGCPSHEAPKHDRIIEKCFFIDSTKSLLLQLADMCTYSARKIEEEEIGHPVRPLHREGIDLLRPLIASGDKALREVIAWMDEQIKKRPGT